MTHENHESIRKIKEIKKDLDPTSLIKFYCVIRYSNTIKLYAIVKMTRKKVYYILKSTSCVFPDIEVDLNINNLNFVSTSKEECIAYKKKFEHLYA